jgi:hypothetical protein
MNMQSVAGGFRASVTVALGGVVTALLLHVSAALGEPPRLTPIVEGAHRLPLTNWTLGVRNLRLLDLEGRDITQRLEPLERDGVVTLRVTGVEPFIAKPRQLETVALADAQRSVLPGGFVVTVPDPLAADAAGEAQRMKLVWFRITASASPLPALWDDRVEAYTTRLSIGLKAPPNAPEGLTPPAGVPVKLLFEGASSSEVAPFSLEEPGIENEKTLALEFRPSAPNSVLLVRSSISDVQLELRAHPRLEVRPTHTRVLGLGLEPVEVNVERVAPHGAGLATNEDMPLLLQVDQRARLEPSTPRIAAGQSRTVFTLRSSGLGALQIRASAGGNSGLATLERTFPIGPLIGVVLGGSLGGFARRFVRGARRCTHRRRILEGLSVSLIAFIAGVLGVNSFNVLPADVIATEAGAFLTGASSGFTGVALLEWLSQRKAPVRARATA